MEWQGCFVEPHVHGQIEATLLRAGGCGASFPGGSRLEGSKFASRREESRKEVNQPEPKFFFLPGVVSPSLTAGTWKLANPLSAK